MPVPAIVWGSMLAGSAVTTAAWTATAEERGEKPQPLFGFDTGAGAVLALAILWGLSK